MTQEELNERIKKHELWMWGKVGGELLEIGAEDDIRGLEFIAEDIRCAVFDGANLSNVRFYVCALQNASFDGAIFDHTDFDRSSISYNEDLILRLAEDIKKSRQKKSPSDESAQAASAKADKKGQ